MNGATGRRRGQRLGGKPCLRRMPCLVADVPPWQPYAICFMSSTDTASSWVWENGSFATAAGVPLSDRGFRYGMSVFESLRVTRGEPEFCEVVRWQGMMPQYHVGHLDLVRQIEERAAAIPHFALAGNAYRGVGIPFCIHSGEQAAERVVGAGKVATDGHR